MAQMETFPGPTIQSTDPMRGSYVNVTGTIFWCLLRTG